MPRQARALSESGYYHVINRGIGKQILFEDEDDSQRFLDTLKRYTEEEHFELICYCLMENVVKGTVLLTTLRGGADTRSSR